MAGHWKQSQARGRSQSPGETGRTDRARNEPHRSCAECWQQWALPGWLPRGTQSSQASCCLSQSSVLLKCWSLTYKLLQIVFSKEKPESVGSIKNEGSKWKEYRAELSKNRPRAYTPAKPAGVRLQLPRAACPQGRTPNQHLGSFSVV